MKRIIISLLVVSFLLCSCNNGAETEISVEPSERLESTQVSDVAEDSSEEKHTESNAISQEDTQNPMEDIVKSGDKVHLCCFRSPIGEDTDEYFGGAILDVDKEELKFTDSDLKCPDSVISELAKQVLGKNRHYSAIECNDGQYNYRFHINMINMTVEPSYSFPADWDYSFSAEIGSFMSYNDEDAAPLDDEDGEVFGYIDRLTLGCSTWCGCQSFVCDIKASSVLVPQGKISYGAAHLATDTRKTVWAEGVDGYGIGESIEIKQMYLGTGYAELTLYSICIVNGYAENETKWQENSRVKSMKLYYEGEYLGDIELEDTIKPQYIDLSPLKIKVGNGFDAHFRFEITDVYKGSKYEDTCLTGIIIDYEGLYAH